MTDGACASTPRVCCDASSRTCPKVLVVVGVAIPLWLAWQKHKALRGRTVKGESRGHATARSCYVKVVLRAPGAKVHRRQREDGLPFGRHTCRKPSGRHHRRSSMVPTLSVR